MVLASVLLCVLLLSPVLGGLLLRKGVVWWVGAAQQPGVKMENGENQAARKSFTIKGRSWFSTSLECF